MEEVPPTEELEEWSDDRFDDEELPDEEKDKFIRGVISMTVWSHVVDEPPIDVMRKASKDPDASREYDKLQEGEDHEFGVAMADLYGIPYRYAGDSVKLEYPWGKRFKDAWVKVGVEPSLAERIVNTAFLGVLSRDDE